MNIPRWAMAVALLIAAVLAPIRAEAQQLSNRFRIDTIAGWGGAVNAFERVGNIGYCGSGQRFVVLDMSNEANIHEIGSLNLDDTVECIAVRGDYAYVGTEGYPHPLLAINIATPSSPHVTWTEGIFAQMRTPRFIRLYGNLALVGDGFYIIAYGLSDPARPVAQLTGQPGSNWYRIDQLGSDDLQISGHLGYAAGNDGYLRIFDLEPDPLHPISLGQVLVPNQPAFAITSLSLQGTLALVQVQVAGAQDFAAVVDVSDPAHPTVVPGSAFTFSSAEVASRSAWIGNYALIADYGSSNFNCGASPALGLVVLDYTHASSPVQVGAYWTNYSAIRDVRVQGDRAYVFCDGQGLVVLDLTNPAQPTRVGGYYSPGLLRDCAKEGNRLYVADVWNGFTVLDVSSPNATPTVLGVYRADPNLHDTHSLKAQNGIVYLAAGFSGIHIVDASNPAGMSLLRQILPLDEDHYQAWYVEVDGAILHASITNYCAQGGPGHDHDGSYRNYDISNLSTPFEVGRAYTDNNHATALATKDGFTLFAYPHDYVISIDTRNPAVPTPSWTASSFPTGQATLSGGDDLALEGNTAVASGRLGNQGVYFLNVVDPAHPQVVAFLPTSGEPKGVAISGTRAYCSSLYQAGPSSAPRASILAIDATAPIPPSPPLLAYSYAGIDGAAERMHAEGNLLYTVCGASAADAWRRQGLVVRRYRCAADMDDNGLLNVNDFVGFINAFASSDPRADIDRSLTLNINDFVAFQSVFVSGCN